MARSASRQPVRAADSTGRRRPDAPASDVLPPEQWWLNPTGWAGWNRLILVVGNLDGDATRRDDVGMFYDYGSFQTKLWIYGSTGTALQSAALAWDSGVGGVELQRCTFGVVDLTGDGTQDEIVVMYRYAAASTALWTITKTPGWTFALWWGPAAAMDGAKLVLSTGDYNADGKADAAILQDPYGPTAGLHTFTTRPDGAGFTAPDLATPTWTGHIGAKSRNVAPEPGRKYQIVPRHSGKCYDTRQAADPAVGLRQWACLTDNANQQFTFERVGASDKYLAKPVAATTCLGVLNNSINDLAPIWASPCTGNGDQQFTIEHITGAGVDTVVRTHTVSSDKCLVITNDSTADNQPVIQYTCNDDPDSQVYLRLLP